MAALSSSAGSSEPGLDTSFKMGDVFAFPNPAVGKKSVTLHAEMGLADKVDFRIYNDLGDKLHEASVSQATVVNGKLAYRYNWDISNLPSGIYVYVAEGRKEASEALRTKDKVAIVK